MRQRGEKHHRAKYSAELVERARVMHDEGAGFKRIARAMGLPAGTVRDWVEYRTRKSS